MASRSLDGGVMMGTPFCLASMQPDLHLNGLNGPWWWLTLIGCAIVTAVWLILYLAKHERKLVSRKVGFFLMSLRIGVLVLLLLTFLEPVISWSRDRNRAGRIVVAVDVSQSMDTRDTQATKAERLRWAKAAGLISNPRLDDWIQSFEEGNEPQWVDDDETSNAEKKRELATARKKNVEDLLEQVSKMPRAEFVRRVLLSSASPLLKELDKISAVDVLIFGGDSRLARDDADESVNAGELEAILKKPGKAVHRDQSDLIAPLDASRAATELAKINAVVLLTDGRQTSAGDPVRIATQLGFAGTPVYSIVFGSENRPKDLAVALLDYPQTVFKKDKPVIKATLKTSGFQGETIEVVLERDKGDPIKKQVEVTGTTTEVQFAVDATEEGRHGYTVKIPHQKGEADHKNNEKPLAITVVDGKVDALILDGSARWEFRFLEIAYSRDKRVKVQSVLFEQPFMNLLNENFFPRNINLPKGEPDPEKSRLEDVDLVIVGDVPPEKMQSHIWRHLEKWVADSGGTLVLSAGKNYFPRDHVNADLFNMLPVEELRAIRPPRDREMDSPDERGFHLALTPDGERETFLQLAENAASNRATWSTLPGHGWGLVGKAKPAATVLAYAKDIGAKGLEAERNSGVIIRQYYGAGQVLWIGVDSTWRWRHRAGDLYHHKFWGQLGRWAVENKAMAKNDRVKLILRRADLRQGDEAVIDARWARRFRTKHPNATAKAEIYRINEPRPFQTLELKPVENRPLTHRVTALDLPVGEYRVKLVVDGVPPPNAGDPPAAPLEGYFAVREDQTPELIDISANRALLGQVAQASSGRVVEADRAGEIPKLIRESEGQKPERPQLGLWDHWMMMLLFFGLLATEWIVRKLHGLP